ncbi:MAG TPA: type II CAAX endopeptidase family protein [Armatimonadota bacterium]|nr:type II CAAX endopeptidase family protein [Armatimonadota bacterium]HOS42360.1 type II CAAX endopeptidase family protein [Armatimonadota bacterium]
MTYEGAPSPEPRVAPAAEREPPLLLALGILCYLGVLAVMWGSAALPGEDRPTPVATEGARAATYLATAAWYAERFSDWPAEIRQAVRPAEHADTAARAWETVAAQTPVAAQRARAEANAAILHSLGGDRRGALVLLDRAGRHDPAMAGAYGRLRAFYADPARPAALTPAAEALLEKLPTGPIFRAQAARRAGDIAAARAALRPGWEAGLRVLLVEGLVVLLIGGLLLFALFGYLLWHRRIGAELRAAAAPAPPVPWGIGAALLVVSGVYLLSFLLQVGLAGFIPRASLAAAAPVVGTLALLVATLLVAGGFLSLLGKPAWAWETFGWRRAPRGAGYGLLALVLALPLLVIAYLIAAALFGMDRQQQPLVEALQSGGPLLQVYLVVVAAVMAPLVEETLFRGLLFRALNARLAFWPAALISALLFAAGHALLLALLPVMLLGMLFAFLTRRAGSVVPSAAAHGVYNLVVSVVALLIGWALNGPGQ